MDKFKTVLNIAQNQKTSLGLGFVALLTAGGEQIFSTVVFKCPCNDWNLTYGMVFLLVPALALFILGLMISNKTWKLFTGLCLHKSKFRWKKVYAIWVVVWQITTIAMVAPVSWIAVALLNGNYFECALTGVNITSFNNYLCREKNPLCKAELQKFPCKGGDGPAADRDAVLSGIRTGSQILGWLLIASILLSSLLFTCVSRCRSPVSYLQLRFWKTYAQEESKQLENFSESHARELAQRNLRSFFQLQPPESITTPSKLAWMQISRFYHFSTMNHYYSPLHQYVETCNKPGEAGEAGEAREAGDVGLRSLRGESFSSIGPDANNPSALAFLDEGGMI